MYKFKNQFFLLIFICITLANQVVVAQTIEATPAPSIDDILRAGTSYGNKTYEGLQGVKEETAEERDIVSFETYGISHNCSIKNLLAKHRFSLALEASYKFHQPSEKLFATVASTNLDEFAKKLLQQSLNESNDSRPITDLFVFLDSELKFNFDANCQVGTRTEIRSVEPKKTISTPNTPSRIFERVLSSVFFKSVMHINFAQLNVQSGNQKYGMGEFSNFCVDIFGVDVTPKKICNPEKITMYCQGDDCYIQPLEYLVENAKITSQGQPEPFKSQVMEIERKLEKQKNKQLEKISQSQG
jgi:hypothetical protein